MNHDILQDRGYVLEEAYFRRQDAELLRKLREIGQTKFDKEELRRSSGITNEELLDQLAKLHLHGETLSAFKLYPLVELAWADKPLEQKEANLVMIAAQQSGLSADSEAMKLLQLWLKRGPREDERRAWRVFAKELCKILSAQELDLFRFELLDHADVVARASGGIFGVFFQVSAKEQHVIDDITRHLQHV